MTSTFTNSLHPRNRRDFSLLIDEKGEVFPFEGKSIPGVCHAQEVGFSKNGKWSDTTWQVEHRPSTTFVVATPDWDTGRKWPEATWPALYARFQKWAPHVKAAAIRSFIHATAPNAAARLDEAEKAVQEFVLALPVEGPDEDLLKAIEQAEHIRRMFA